MSLSLPPEVSVPHSAYKTPSAVSSGHKALRDGAALERVFGRGLALWAKGGAAGAWTYHFQYALRGADGSLHIPDHILVGPDRAVLFETKLTFTPKGLEQLARYAPLVGRHFSLPTVLVLVAQTLRPGVSQMPKVSTIEESIACSLEGPYLWHLWRPLEFLRLHSEAQSPELPPFEGEIPLKSPKAKGVQIRGARYWSPAAWRRNG